MSRILLGGLCDCRQFCHIMPRPCLVRLKFLLTPHTCVHSRRRITPWLVVGPIFAGTIESCRDSCLSPAVSIVPTLGCRIPPSSPVVNSAKHADYIFDFIIFICHATCACTRINIHFLTIQYTHCVRICFMCVMLTVIVTLRDKLTRSKHIGVRVCCIFEG